MKFDRSLIDYCRNQFPALQRTENGKQVVYFDGPAGTQVPTRVAEAMTYYLLHANSNLHGQFGVSQHSDELIEQSHRAHANFVGADSGDEIAFGQNMTSLTFAFSRALAKTWKAGDEIIVTALDHDANITPWTMAAEDAGVKVHFVDYRPDDYMLDLDDLANKLNDKTKLVAVGCASNATGGINPVKKISEMAHAVEAKVYLDAVHYGPHGLIDVKKWDCDFLACSNYKFFGPHLGLLWGKPELMNELAPYKVRPASNEKSAKWMTGTQSHESIVGGNACINYLCDIGLRVGSPTETAITEDESRDHRNELKSAFDAIVEYERMLSSTLIDRFSSIDGLEIIGIKDKTRVNERFPTFSVRHNKVSSAELAKRLGESGICVWNGNYYALEFSTRMGFEPDGMVRIGLVHYNTIEEIDRMIEAMEQATSTQTKIAT